MSTSNSFLSALLELLARLLGGGKPPAPPVDDGKLVPLAPRVLVVIYNPIVDAATGRRLNQELGWFDPDTLAQGYIDDLRECSGGLVNYQIVERVLVNEFPKHIDGFSYQPQEYIAAYRARTGFHNPDLKDYDYAALIKQYDLLNRVGSNQLDEVWLFGFPYIGYWESTMAGKGAFYCNSDPQPNTESCPRRFVIMGFSYERGNGEMLENITHLAESVLARVFGSEDFLARSYNAATRTPDLGSRPRNLFERFLLFDQIAPGMANCGNVHFAPNSTGDYQWDNLTPVLSCADDWLHFPDLPDPPNYQTMTAVNWGNSKDPRPHHTWWLRRIPKAGGLTNGIANNWWKYIIDVNHPIFDHRH
jgi:hypothetical protein